MAQPIDPRTGRPAEPGDESFQWEQPYINPADRLLGEARYTLSKAHDLSADTAREGNRAAMEAPQTHDIKQKSFARNMTDFADTMAMGSGLAGMIPSPLSPALLGLSGALAIPGAVRQTLNPDIDESRLGGAIQGGLAALPLAGSLRSLRGLKEAAPILEAPFRSGGLKYAVRDAMANAPRNFAETGVQGDAGLRSILAKLNQEAEAGYRTVPKNTNPFLEALPETVIGQPHSTGHLPQPPMFSKPLPSRVPIQKLLGPAQSIQLPSGQYGKQMEALIKALKADIPQNAPRITEGSLSSVSQDLPAAWKQFVVPESVPGNTEAIRDFGKSGWGEDLLASLSQGDARRKRLTIPARARAYRANTVIE